MWILVEHRINRKLPPAEYDAWFGSLPNILPYSSHRKMKFPGQASCKAGSEEYSSIAEKLTDECLHAMKNAGFTQQDAVVCHHRLSHSIFIINSLFLYSYRDIFSTCVAQLITTTRCT